MRRFELVEGSSSKFWEIALDGSSFTVTWGRIGTAGQTQTKSFDSDDKAKKEHDKLVAEKTKKGYSEVEGASKPSSGTPTPKAPPAPKKDADDEAAATAPTATTKAPKAARSAKATKADDAAAAPSPTPAAALAMAPPPAPPSLAEEDQIFWNDGLLKRVIARRGGVSVRIAALPTEKKARAEVQKAWDARKEAFAGLAKRKGAGLDALTRVAGLLDGGVPDADDAATLMAWLAFQPDYRIEVVIDEVMEWLIAAGGHALAVTSTLLSLERCFPVQHYYAQKDEPVELKMEPTKHWGANFHDGGNLRGLDRLRELLILADDASYAKAREAAAAVRATGTWAQQIAASFLFPTEQDWVKADQAIYLQKPGGGAKLLLASVVDVDWIPATVTFSVDDFIPHRYRRSTSEGDLAATLLDGCGLKAAPLLARVEPSGYADSGMLKLWYGTLAAVGADDTIAVVAKNVGSKEAQAALADAGLHQPRRVMRMVAKSAATRGKAGEPPRAVLGMLVRRSPELVEEVKPFLDADGQRALAAAIAEQGEAVEDAAAADVPSFLVKPPWHEKKTKAAGPQLTFTPTPPAPVLRFSNAMEQQQWANKSGWGRSEHSPAEWKKIAADTTDLYPGELASCPGELVEQLGPRTKQTSYSDDRWYAKIVATHGLKAVPFIKTRLDIDFAGLIPWIVPVGDASLAGPMALGFATKKSLRDPTRQWMLRHPEHAACGLLPLALGKPGKARDHAELALRFMAQNGQEKVILDVAEASDVKKEAKQILEASPLDKFPAKLPKLPAYADAAALPRPVLKDKQGALPVAAVQAMLELLSFSTFDDPYAGIAELKERCEPKSLARFSWALFSSWLVNGANSKEGFCFTQLGFFGDDDCARKLAALVREWPGEGGHARAVTGLDVLTQIGTDVALMHLNGIALKVKFKGLQEKAQEKVELIAEARGLTREELEDRLAPDLGLDDDGSMKLDFGPRFFTVGFDEALRPFVKDSEGARLKDMPKPKKDDDEEKAKAASERWSQLKKDAKQAASLQILRLEMAMCGQRRFEGSSFVELFVEHPLVFHIVRRLVWAVYDDAGEKIVHTFRVAEDRTFADDNDDAFELPAGCKVGIPHTLELTDAVAGKWSQIFGDYELVQPFPQLGRPSHVPTDEQKKALQLDTVKGLTVKTGKVLGLETRRWRRGAPQDGGVACWMEKHLKDGRVVYLDLDPGLFTGMLSESPEQTLGSCVLADNEHSYWSHSKGQQAFGTLDKITFSELVRDLESLKG
jgi:predicted DNA-binding WGR domain protein